MPAVSVVIPTIGGPYLDRAVDSVLGQTLADLELVLVADGYAGQQLSAIEASDRRIRVIRQPRMGVSVARNVGVAQSSSELVAFMDDDDISLPERLEAQVRHLSLNAEASFCSTLMEVIDEDGVVVSEPRGQCPSYEAMLSGRFGICMSTVMVRRSSFLAVGGFDPTLATGEDLDFYLNVGRLFGMTFLPDVLLQYRRHGNNTSGDPLVIAEDVEFLLSKHRMASRRSGDLQGAALASSGILTSRRDSGDAAFRRSRQAWRERDLPAAVKMATVSLRLSPFQIPSRFARKLWRSLADRSTG